MTMKSACGLYFAMLVIAHCACGFERPWERPLSSFRSGEFGWVGYMLFAVIGLIGALYVFNVQHLPESDDKVDKRGFFALLAIIVATPSGWVLHEAAAIVMLGALYLYFATVFYRIGPIFFAIHLCVPLVLAVATRFQSYGSWQKLIISYFVVVAAIHAHVIKQKATVLQKTTTA